jgi:hypothetical protein
LTDLIKRAHQHEFEQKNPGTTYVPLITTDRKEHHIIIDNTTKNIPIECPHVSGYRRFTNKGKNVKEDGAGPLLLSAYRRVMGFPKSKDERDVMLKIFMRNVKTSELQEEVKEQMAQYEPGEKWSDIWDDY